MAKIIHLTTSHNCRDEIQADIWCPHWHLTHADNKTQARRAEKQRRRWLIEQRTQEAA